MGLSRRTLETLIDLVEIKLSYMEVYDQKDSRELANLERCLGELRNILSSTTQDGAMVFPQSPAKRSRAAVRI